MQLKSTLKITGHIDILTGRITRDNFECIFGQINCFFVKQPNFRVLDQEEEHK